MAKVSVIIAVYNVEKYIIKCLESIKKQTFLDFECLVISDGSIDNSIALAREFVKDDNRFRIIEKENGGYGSVLEKGIEMASGDYVLICDPDDYLSDYAIEHLYNCAISNDSDLVFGAKYDIYENPHEEIYSPGYDDSKYGLKGIKTYNYTDKDFSMFFSFECSPHSKLYKKDIIYKGPYPHKVSHTDMILYCLTMNKIKTITYTEKSCSYYLLEREGNTMTAIKDKFVNAHITVLDYAIGRIDDNCNVQSYLCILDTIRYCVSFLNRTSNSEEFIREYRRIFERLYSKRSLFYRYLNYAQGGLKDRISNKLLFNPLTSRFYLNIYLSKNAR